MKKQYIQPDTLVSRIEAMSMICISAGEQLNIVGEGSLSGSRIPRRGDNIDL